MVSLVTDWYKQLPPGTFHTCTLVLQQYLNNPCIVSAINFNVNTKKL